MHRHSDGQRLLEAKLLSTPERPKDVRVVKDGQ